MTAYARVRLEQWLKAVPGRNQKMFADLAGGLTPSFMSQFRGGTLGLGWDSARGFATALGMELSEFIKAAEEWDANGRSLERIEREDRYPNRGLAIRLLNRLVSPAVLEDVQRVQLNSRVDLSPIEWVRMIANRETDLQQLGSPSARSDTAKAESKTAPPPPKPRGKRTH